MKRSKQTIINRRTMHRYQQQYRLWHRIASTMPLLRIDTSIIDDWSSTEWVKYCRQGVIFIK